MAVRVPRSPVVPHPTPEPWLRRLGRVWRRLVDIVLAIVLFVALLPVLLVTVVAIKLEDGGPVLARQGRHGLRGPFRMLRFRTVVRGAPEGLEELFDRRVIGGRRRTPRNDPRLTRVGTMLRTQGLDELPHLVNVLRGDLSLGGPQLIWRRTVGGSVS